MENTKVCITCGTEKEVRHFPFYRSDSQNRRNECADCRNEKARQYRKEYYQKNKEAVKEYQSDYRDKHRWPGKRAKK